MLLVTFPHRHNVALIRKFTYAKVNLKNQLIGSMMTKKGTISLVLLEARKQLPKCGLGLRGWLFIKRTALQSNVAEHLSQMIGY